MRFVLSTMLGIIINPKSGKRAFRAQRIYLFRLLRHRHQPFAYRVTQYAGHATELARDLVERGYDQILVLGGDGTLSEALNGIMTAQIEPEKRAQICLGIMPRGTGNDWSRYWNLTKNHKESLRRFFEGEGHPIDVGCVTYYRNSVAHHRYFINSVGFGVDPLCCKIADQLKYYIGSHSINYLFALIAAFFKQKPIHMGLYVDDQLVVEDGLFTMNIGNGPYSGGGIKQNPEADPTDGIFQSMFVTKPTVRKLIEAVPNLFNGKLSDMPFVHSVEGKKIELRTKKHLLFEADGILNDVTGTCIITCQHHALQFKV